MKKKIYNLGILAGILLVFTACQQDEYTLGDLITPSNVDLSYEIVGMDAENPYGDGSGVVNFTASAEDEITFNFIFGDGKDNKVAQNGEIAHQFSVNGINIYNVTVIAVGTGGISSSKTIQIEVFSSFSDVEALQFLTGGDTRTWYWAADQPGHAGLGPNNPGEDNGEGNLAYASWWSAPAWDKAASGAYDSEFVFTKVDGGFTFEHKNPAGVAFIPGTYAGKIGVDGDTTHGLPTVDISGVKNGSFSPSASIATIPGAYRGTTMSFSDGGFIGFYVGKSDYEIIKITDNILQLRVEEDGTFAWYHTFTTVKPVQ